MSLLLDTCATIWIVSEAEMAEPAIAAMDRAYDRGDPVYVSAITAWEIGLLASKGRFASPLSPQKWFERLMQIENVALSGLTPSIMIESSFLPGDAPRDPADRMIISTARACELAVVTRDRRILDYGAAGHVRTIPC